MILRSSKIMLPQIRLQVKRRIQKTEAGSCLTPESASDIKENESTSVFIIYNTEQNVISRTIKIYYQDIFAQKENILMYISV